jgi:3-isopropylmalate dehydrogenase
MMFEMSFGLTAEGAEIRRVVDLSLAEGVVTEDLKEGGAKGNSTAEVGDYLVQQILG